MQEMDANQTHRLQAVAELSSEWRRAPTRSYVTSECNISETENSRLITRNSQLRRLSNIKMTAARWIRAPTRLGIYAAG